MRILVRDEELGELSRDSGIIEIRPAAAYVASSEADVMEAMAAAKARLLPLTPRGSGTGIPSQSVGRGIVLLQDRRQATLADRGSVVCEPALVKSELNRFLDTVARWVPVDPSSYETCSVGGMVSNNSSGSRSYKYGSTIQYVEELRVVLPEEGLVSVVPLGIDEALSAGGSTGRVAKLLLDNKDSIARDVPRVTKNSSGYRLEEVVHDGVFDLPRLFVGSEGTLGVVTSVMFRTLQKPRAKTLLIFETSLAELDRLVAALRAYAPSAIELVDKSVFEQTGRADRIRTISRTEEPLVVFAEFDSRTDTLEVLDRVAADATIAGFEPITLVDPGDVVKAWQIRNETLTVAADMRKGTRSPVPGVEDLVAPPAQLGELVRLVAGEFERRGLDYISYGHAGDANLHMRPLLDSKSTADMHILDEIMAECFGAVWKMGGSITGEHGDGMLRAPYVRRQYPHSYDVMLEVKRTLDPKGMMNPGVKMV
ncbi:MAG TPA: FAD-binding oxidoreductase [Nitrososphaerales archaeon]|nr:FAD-binding oxidoreductase [Nitrososphaerales archaeon]